MRTQGVKFSITEHAAWAPGIDTPQAWLDWARAPHPAAIAIVAGGADPALPLMAPMLRRRAGFLGKMALEVAYRCLGARRDVATVFCSRHGEVVRAVELLNDLAAGAPLSPTAFGLAVHNASAGLFSIARAERSNHVALAAGASSVEHAVIEACGLLADGAAEVLLVVCDQPLPAPFEAFEDCAEQPFAWAWLMAPAGAAPVSLGLDWSATPEEDDGQIDGQMPGGLAILRFQLQDAAQLERVAGCRRWRWTRHV